MRTAVAQTSCTVLDSYGQLYIFGAPLTGGVMAVPYEKSRVFRQVAATSRSFAALDTEGAVLVWGDLSTGGLYYQDSDGSGRTMLPSFPAIICPPHLMAKNIVGDKVGGRVTLRCIPREQCSLSE